MTTARIAMMVIAFCGSVAFAGNYNLTIDGKEVELDLGETVTVTLPSGPAVKVKLEKKEVATFKRDTYSFNHPGSNTPVKATLSEDLEQTMLTTAQGSFLLIQEYSATNPSSSLDLFIKEFTTDDVKAGYNVNWGQALFEYPITGACP